MRVRRIAAFALVLLVAFLIVPGFVTKTFAGTTTDLTTADGATVCPALGGTWEAGNNCLLTTAYTINSGDTLIIDTGVALEVGTGGTLNVGGVLNVTQLLVIFGPGVVNVLSGGVIENYNGIDVYGVLNNHGVINNNTAAIYIGLYGGYTGTLNNYGVINQNSEVGGYAEITITDGGVLNNECGGEINNPSPGVIKGTVTEVACSGVPEFPASSLGPLLLTGLLFPALLLAARKFRRPI